MTIDEFWYSTDIEIHAFEKAYFNRINQLTWLQGYYDYLAQASVLSSIFTKRKNDRLEYPKKPIETKNTSDKVKQKKNEKDKDKEFRDILLECY